MLEEKKPGEQLAELARVMLSLESEEEARNFFEDLFTINELQAVCQRLAVARLLRQKVTYQEIAERTGASTATISRVNRSLLYGAGGYQRVLAREGGAQQSEGEEAKR